MEDFAKIGARLFGKFKWLRQLGLINIIVLFLTGVTLLIVRKFEGLHDGWIFSIAADLTCMLAGVMIYISCFHDKDRTSEYTHLFTLLLTTACAACFLDASSWLIEGIPELAILNRIVNTFHYINGAILVNSFWHYCSHVLALNEKYNKIATRILEILLVPTIISCLVNIWYPLFFEVDAGGNYARSNLYLLSQIYVLVGFIILIVSIILSKANLKTRIVTSCFILIPVGCPIATINFPGVSLQYSASMIAIILIYCIVFAERESARAMTEKELSLAKRIQSEMLPNIFPAFPHRQDFDVYALMNPAKEVGGDFYDFFLIDDTHLALVIADVSGKGVPAALFMMISKIVVAQYTLQGNHPSKILENTNNLICANNPEEMFVTVWLGILDLKTGELACSNAGHEFPMLKSSNGKFTIYNDSHGFVIGGMDGLTYPEYKLNLTPGSKIFVYTDGVTEAKNKNNEQYGMDRALSALNENPNATPEQLCKLARQRISEFVGPADQFDDITMLCLQFNGPQKE